MLKTLGCEVDLASNGVEAVDAATKKNYDLILMDMQMPRMDGLTATRAIRALPGHRNTPIVALTANAFADDRQRCIDAGMNDYLSKPVTPTMIATVLRQWLPALPIVKQAKDEETGSDSFSQVLAKIPGIDASYSARRTPTQMKDYFSLLKRYVTMHGNDMKQIKNHLDANDRKTAQEVAHNLKGVSGMVGARQMAKLANDLLIQLRGNAETDAMTPLLEACIAELNALVSAIRNIP
jgi:two-component system sensor histidine kinase/response regulator